MRIITPSEFRDTFDNVVRNVELEYLNRWHSATECTDLLRRTVIPSVSENLELESYCRKDYYLLDAILYDEKDESNFAWTPNDIHAKFISVAIEFENDPSRTAKEINRLQIYNSPLKVLITYPRGRFSEAYLLKMYAEIVASGDIFNDFSTHRRQLIAFATKIEQTINWRYFVYASGSFDRI